MHDELPAAVQQPDTHRDRIRQLENKVAQLEQAVDSHAVIDQAIGVLVAVGRMTPAEAWDVLRETSMCTNIKVRHVADLVVTWGESGRLAADIREQLSMRLGHRPTA
ncbi:ANTAR domain-containing protein [Streptomyces sp. DH24]|uniref:ANTAR domain-containing protein n=1 Tax=Streptomyces sp. DH24 TaxID=3040123 RepID=UPI002442605E|nr:ANTAR domain-containing protein [Streptomyces sp. DH24]MDG9719886.1 ANTAR domain-containing protein [Streptomyces sp. DH24]